MVGKHSHGDSRLTCIDCGETICAKCFVQCPVGFRCQGCSGKFQSHLIVVTPWVAVRTVLCCIALGSIFGFVLPSLGGGMIFLFVVPYFVGALAGKVVHKVAGYKLGAKIVASIVGGLVVGMICSPLSADLFGIVNSLISTPSQSAALITSLLYSLGPAIVFVFGVLSPILYGYSRRS